MACRINMAVLKTVCVLLLPFIIMIMSSNRVQVAAQTEICGQLDICLIIDSSGSIRDTDYGNWDRVLNFVNSIVNDPQVVIGPQNTQVGLVSFSNQAIPQFYLNNYTSKIELNMAIAAVPYGGGGTNTPGGLQVTREQCFSSFNGDRDYAPNVAIIITDGIPTIPYSGEPNEALAREYTLTESTLLKNAGVGIFAIGVTNLIDEALLREISSPPQLLDVTYFTTPDFDQLAPLLELLLNSACSVLTPQPRPSTTQTDCVAGVDLGFVLDMSESIVYENARNWELVKNFTVNVALAFPISDTLTRAGVVKFSDAAALEFHLDEYMTPDSLRTNILAIQRYGLDTNFPAALRMLRTQLFNNRGDRPDIRNIAFFLTDGRANIDADQVEEEAELAKASGIDIFAIGVTNDVDVDELNVIATESHDNHYKHVFLIDDFDQLRDFINVLVDEICEFIEPTPDPGPFTTTPSNEITPSTLEPSTGCTGDSVDAVFVVDSSGSVGETEFQKILDFVSSVVQDLAVEQGRIRVALVVFSTNVQAIFYLDTYTTREAMLQAIDNVQYMRGVTNTADALRFVRTNIFTSSRGDRSDAQNLVIVITDGESSNPTNTITEARALKGTGAHVITIGVGNWLSVYELQAIASYPVGQNLLQVNNFDSLSTIRTTIRDAICDNTNECNSNPCYRGYCIDYIRFYLCDCPPGYAGPNCELECRIGADVVFVLDTSGSVGPANFQTMVDFVIAVVERLDIDNANSTTEGVRVGLIAYSTTTYFQFNLNAFTNKRDLLNAIMVRYQGGTTNTAEAIRFVRQQMFQPNVGDRQSIPNTMVIITDGRSDNPDQTWSEAIQAREQGISIMAIGIGSNVDDNELMAIASEPTSGTVFTVDSFTNLNSLIINVASGVCNNDNECNSNPCRNGALCIDLIFGYYCGPCPPDYTGINCERPCSGESDVVFLVDSSGSIRHERFPLVLDFVVSIVNQLDISEQTTRVGFVYWSSSASVGFYLNQYYSRQDVIQAVLRIPFMGQRTYTSQGIQMMQNDVFTSGRGDRSNAPNYCIIITDGNSNIQPQNTIPMAIDARVDGTHFIVVAVGTQVNMIELEGMASLPVTANIFTVNSISSLAGVYSQIVTSICDSQNECNSNPCQNGGQCVNQINMYYCVCTSGWTDYNCNRRCSRQYDVSLILDLSGSMEDEYRMTIDFARQIVYGLDMTYDRVRVSAIAYSDNVFSWFSLNTYSSKIAVINALNYYHQGGRTNTQSALSLSRNEVFSTSNGDRAGVENIAIVISDGDSNVNEYNTITEADRMRNQGIRVFSIATGENPDLAEMNGIANNPDSEYLYRLRNVGEVNSVASRLLNYLCQ